MLFFSSVKPVLEFKKLSDISDDTNFQKNLEKVTAWFTEAWSYIHDKNKTSETAIQDRKKYLAENADKVHLVFYDKTLVGAFRIDNKEYAQELIESQDKKGLKEKFQISEIWFMFVDKPFRSLGAGRKIFDEIKRQSREKLGAHMILLETLKPTLNRFYTTQGATFITENHIDYHPTDVLKFEL